jgi:hypothetical protein
MDEDDAPACEDGEEDDEGWLVEPDEPDEAPDDWARAGRAPSARAATVEVARSVARMSMASGSVGEVRGQRRCRRRDPGAPPQVKARPARHRRRAVKKNLI